MTENTRNAIGRSMTTAHGNYNKSLNSYAFYKVHNHAMGEDLVQDTFLKTWKYLAKGGKIEIMKAFLYHVLNNLIIDEYRKEKHKTSSLDDLLEKGYEPRDEKTDSNNLFDKLDGKEAILLIKQLPEVYKKVMHMRFVQDLSLKEMSLITGKTKNSIAVQENGRDDN